MFKTLLFRGSRYKLELWDTAGQEKYRSLVKSYLKNADCCIYVHDVNGTNQFTQTSPPTTTSSTG